jgi:hypothetical protein
MTQKEQVIAALEEHGGFATFAELYQLVDASRWGTKTASATIRRIVQQDAKCFYRIVPGQWGLVSMRRQIESCGADARNSKYTHGYYQGLLVDIGNAENYVTYVPPADQNRPYSQSKLGDKAKLRKIYEFTSEKILRKAKTVDTIWFNCREMPVSFFEVEHTTDIQRSLDKFYELQDFNSKFYIVADSSNKARFDDLLSYSHYREICKRVKFRDYESLYKYYCVRMQALGMSL